MLDVSSDNDINRIDGQCKNKNSNEAGCNLFMHIGRQDEAFVEHAKKTIDKKDVLRRAWQSVGLAMTKYSHKIEMSQGDVFRKGNYS